LFQRTAIDARTKLGRRPVRDGSIFGGGGRIVVSADRPKGACLYRLVSPGSEREWQAYHGIRRKVFHLPRPEEPPGPDCHALLLLLGEQPIGAIQVDDLRNDVAALRLVAIEPGLQGQGHGRALLEGAERFALGLGCGAAVVYATPEAAGFYQSLGYDEEDWDPVCMAGIVQMIKKL
jgi:GNAT superfamily N-acetyltransferase